LRSGQNRSAFRRIDDREDCDELREQAIGFTGDALYVLTWAAGPTR
jgi:hypothetical protein